MSEYDILYIWVVRRRTAPQVLSCELMYVASKEYSELQVGASLSKATNLTGDKLCELK